MSYENYGISQSSHLEFICNLFYFFKKKFILYLDNFVYDNTFFNSTFYFYSYDIYVSFNNIVNPNTELEFFINPGISR